MENAHLQKSPRVEIFYAFSPASERCAAKKISDHVADRDRVC